MAADRGFPDAAANLRAADLPDDRTTRRDDRLAARRLARRHFVAAVRHGCRPHGGSPGGLRAVANRRDLRVRRRYAAVSTDLDRGPIRRDHRAVVSTRFDRDPTRRHDRCGAASTDLGRDPLQDDRCRAAVRRAPPDCAARAADHRASPRGRAWDRHAAV
jgi:hypothetical protein